MPNFFDQFDAAPAVAPAAQPAGRNFFDQFDAPTKITVRPLDKMLEPITSYPETYSQMQRGARETIGSGIENIKSSIAAQPETPAEKGQAAIDFAKGVGKTAMGSLDYVTSPINAALRTVVGKPIEENTGIPKEITETVGSFMLPIPSKIPLPTGIIRGKAAVVPAASKITKVADTGYDAMRAIGDTIPVPVAEFKDVADNIKTGLSTRGFRPSVTPKVHGVLDDIAGGLDNPNPDLSELINAKLALKEVAGGADKSERKAAMMAIPALDAKIRQVSPQVGAMLKENDANYASAMQSKTIDKAIERGQANAATSGNGGNVDNAIRQQMRPFAINEKKQRGLTADEIEAANTAATGGPLRSTLRAVGKLDPTAHSLATLFHLGATLPTGGMNLPVAALGFAARKLSERLTLNDANKVSEIIRSRSPLASTIGAPMQQWGIAAQEFQVSPTARNFAKVSIASRNLSNTLRGTGVSISPDDLLRSLQGPMKSAADDEQP